MRKQISKLYAFFLVFVTPLGAILPFYLNITQSHWVAALIYYCVTGLGVSVGYHRLITHRAFEANCVVRYILTLFGATAMQGPPLEWANTHIKHHIYCDSVQDPHSPITGLLYSHCGWLFKESKTPKSRLYGRHLYKDKIVMHFTKYYLIYSIVSLVLPVLWGIEAFVVCSLLRLFVVSQATWMVNSVCHKWGTRPHDTMDDSRNNFLVALLTFGEGWHNNHHHRASSARIGEKWYQIDFGKYLIYMLYALRLVKRIR